MHLALLSKRNNYLVETEIGIKTHQILILFKDPDGDAENTIEKTEEENEIISGKRENEEMSSDIEKPPKRAKPTRWSPIESSAIVPEPDGHTTEDDDDTISATVDDTMSLSDAESNQEIKSPMNDNWPSPSSVEDTNTPNRETLLSESSSSSGTVNDSLSLSNYTDSNSEGSPRPENEGLALPLPIPNRIPKSVKDTNAIVQDADGHTCRSMIYEKCPGCKDFKFKEGDGKIKWHKSKKYAHKFNMEISTSMFNILYYNEEAELVLFPAQSDRRSSFQLHTKTVNLKEILQKAKPSKRSEKKTLIRIEFSYDIE